LKERSERIKGGSVLEKWEKGRGVWAKQPSSSSLPHDIEQRRQGGRPMEGGRGAGDLVHGDGREVGQNEEELKGSRFRSLPRAGVLWRGGSTAAGGGRLWWSVVAVLGGLGGKEARLGWCVARWGAGPALL
jgi:hypothetical protein